MTVAYIECCPGVVPTLRQQGSTQMKRTSSPYLIKATEGAMGSFLLATRPQRPGAAATGVASTGATAAGAAGTRAVAARAAAFAARRSSRAFFAFVISFLVGSRPSRALSLSRMLPMGWTSTNQRRETFLRGHGGHGLGRTRWPMADDVARGGIAVRHVSQLLPLHATWIHPPSQLL
eukprot:7360270-Prymnesium_polylepis.1